MKGRGEERDASVVRALVAWYDRSARDLPWRRTRDPYAIWLSEVMLQQTRVETVIPYFERFLRRFPDVTALASAELDEVLSLWSGLGYYRRARGIHACARAVVERHGGRFPEEASALRALPGIGPYTAGAVSSIAFEQREPLVDGNVSRVLARLEGIDVDIKSTAGAKLIWAAAGRLVPAERPGAFNQALMELGATLCTPRDPACLICPVREHCRARAEGREHELPVVGEKRAVPTVPQVAAVVASGALVLLGRRREDGLFGGLWEPPMVEASSMEEAREALTGAGVDGARVELVEAGRVRHVLTHREMDVLVLRAETKRRWALGPPTTAPYEKLGWMDPDAEGFGISTLARKILSAARPAKRKRKARPREDAG